ncbi:protein O-mannosyl-transferase Tmtc3-like [Palaemon carinicauda]|uniref:protein O-mannosyl-transferase Tmtc3-like n=1 Tax=Palaemon carinicauda TaxID=392227 RepID=UPI0035B62DF3
MKRVATTATTTTTKSKYNCNSSTSSSECHQSHHHHHHYHHHHHHHHRQNVRFSSSSSPLLLLLPPTPHLDRQWRRGGDGSGHFQVPRLSPQHSSDQQDLQRGERLPREIIYTRCSTSKDGGSSSPKLTNGIIYGGPILLAVALYLNTLQAGFVYDDHRAVLGNQDVVGSGPWWRVFEHDFWGSPLARKASHGSWRPVTTLSFRWNVMVARMLSRSYDMGAGDSDINPTTSSGNSDVPQHPPSPANLAPPTPSRLDPLQTPSPPLHSPVPTKIPSAVPSTVTPSLNTTISASTFHVINVALHAAVTAAYVGVLKCAGVSPWVRLGAGALFAAHPVHVEAVAGVVGRAELLAALAFCLALAAYIKYLRGRDDTERGSGGGGGGRGEPVGGWRRASCGHGCGCWDEHQRHKSFDLAKSHSGGENNAWRCMQIPSWAWLMASVGGAGVAMACKEQGVTALGVALLFHVAVIVSNTHQSKPVLRVLIRELWPGCLGTILLLWGRVSVSSYTPTFTPADNPTAHAPSVFTRAFSIGRAWVNARSPPSMARHPIF